MPETNAVLFATNKEMLTMRYVVRIRGVLGDTVLSAFPGLEARTSGTHTVLTGLLPDQAALHGVLAQIEALGLELVEVRRMSQRDR